MSDLKVEDYDLGSFATLENVFRIVHRFGVMYMVVTKLSLHDQSCYSTSATSSSSLVLPGSVGK